MPLFTLPPPITHKKEFDWSWREWISRLYERFIDPRYPQEVTVVNNADFPYTVQATDYILLCFPTGGGNRFVDLPAGALENYKYLIIKNTGAAGSTITIRPTGAETIDGVATLGPLAVNVSTTIIYDQANTNWCIL